MIAWTPRNKLTYLRFSRREKSFSNPNAESRAMIQSGGRGRGFGGDLEEDAWHEFAARIRKSWNTWGTRCFWLLRILAQHPLFPTRRRWYFLEAIFKGEPAEHLVHNTCRHRYFFIGGHAEGTATRSFVSVHEPGHAAPSVHSGGIYVFLDTRDIATGKETVGSLWFSNLGGRSNPWCDSKWAELVIQPFGAGLCSFRVYCSSCMRAVRASNRDLRLSVCFRWRWRWHIEIQRNHTNLGFRARFFFSWFFFLSKWVFVSAMSECLLCIAFKRSILIILFLSLK